MRVPCCHSSVWVCYSYKSGYSTSRSVVQKKINLFAGSLATAILIIVKFCFISEYYPGLPRITLDYHWNTTGLLDYLQDYWITCWIIELPTGLPTGLLDYLLDYWIKTGFFWIIVHNQQDYKTLANPSLWVSLHCKGLCSTAYYKKLKIFVRIFRKQCVYGKKQRSLKGEDGGSGSCL